MCFKLEAKRERARQSEAVRPRDREPSRGDDWTLQEVTYAWQHSWSSDDTEDTEDNEDNEDNEDIDTDNENEKESVEETYNKDYGTYSDKEQEALLSELSTSPNDTEASTPPSQAEIISQLQEHTETEDQAYIKEMGANSCERLGVSQISDDEINCCSDDESDIEEIIENIIENAVGLVEGFRAIKDSMLLQSLTDALQWEHDDQYRDALQQKHDDQYHEQLNVTDSRTDTETEDEIQYNEIVDENNSTENMYEDYNEPVKEVTIEEDCHAEEETEESDTLIGQLCQTDWYKDYVNSRDRQQSCDVKSSVYVEEQESGEEYIKGNETKTKDQNKNCNVIWRFEAHFELE